MISSMKPLYSLFATVLISLFMLVGCDSPSPKVINDLSNTSYQLVTQDSTKVTFPDDFMGKPMITAYIYTSCRTICPAITANMKKISQQIPDNEQVQFVLISFDPKRDTPSRLRDYRKKFQLDPQKFTLLTGDSSSVYSLMDEIGINTNVIPADSTGKDMGYMFTHTNQINLFDSQGRIRGEYGGSMVPPKNVIEDLNKLE